MRNVFEQFDLTAKTAVVTGGGGVLGSLFARTLAAAGAAVWVTDLDAQSAERVAGQLRKDQLDGRCRRLDVLDRASLEAAARDIGPVDILINAAGGNMKEATTSQHQPFFDLPLDAMQRVVALNLFGGALLPCQVFARGMASREQGGAILNISSMNAFRPLTRIPAYSAAKAAVSNFTQWLAVHLAQEYNPRIRVNALAPGFFLTQQNHYLLTDEKTGQVTDRGRAILEHTPMKRFGVPEDLAGPTLWLCSDAAAFVTGIVLPVDGGFSAFSGV